MAKVEAAEEVEGNIMSYVKPRVTCNADIARSSATLKHIVDQTKR